MVYVHVRQSKASQQVSVVAGLAVTALGYITGVRALRKAVRHRNMPVTYPIRADHSF